MAQTPDLHPILQRHLPKDMRAGRALPGVQPEHGAWLRVDEAYAAQMTHRLHLLEQRPDEVLYQAPEAAPAALELLNAVIAELPGLGFGVDRSTVRCPDGRMVDLSDDANPMHLLGRLLQNDFVLMEKRGAEHVLSAAVLCFPASWRLREKAGQPLTNIHVPVAEYDNDLARRVQRLFDGIQVGRPLWRFNQLWYDDPELFQPRSALEPRRVTGGSARGPYYRSERQTLLRLPESRAVVFAIHTYVLARADVRPVGL
ncbi:MAG: DUF3445 domain-containing protein [Tateyamaria sp.]|jgi:hypothetical protein|nr:DUF3445 domain-containing protein [Tateyamaria sp.]